MKFFKSNKAKSYSAKQKSQADPNPAPNPLNEHKSLLSVSPSESAILNVSNGKAKSMLPSGNLPDAPSLNQPQSDNKSLDEPALIRPQSAFEYMPNKEAPDDEPENSFMSAQGMNPPIKKNSEIEPPASEAKPLRAHSKNTSDLDLALGKSLTELGPQDAEITEKDLDKGSKLPNMRLDLNPFSEKKKSGGGYSDQRKHSKEPTSSSRVPLIIDVETRSPDIPGLGKEMSESFPLTGLLESPPIEGGILTMPGGHDSGKLQPDKNIRDKRDKKALSVSFVDPKEDASVIFKRAASERLGHSRDESLSGVEIGLVTEKDRKGKEKLSWLFKRKMTEADERSPMMIRMQIAVGIVIYIGLVYVGLPFAMFFAAYGYEDDMIVAIMNFGFLGFFQGIVQALLLYELIDVPIKKKIREIEGKNRGLINPGRYLVVNKLHTMVILVLSTGLQMAAGITMQKMHEPVNGTKIMVSSLCTTAIKGLLWLVMIWIKSPRTLKNEKRILDSELKEIGQIRKDFMADLYDTRKKMEIRSINQNIVSGVPQGVSSAYLGLGSNVVSTVDVDARKLLHKVYDFSSEFKRIRLSSIKTFMILILSLAQILIMIHIINLTQDTEDVAASLLCVVLLFFVGSIFGLMDLFTSPGRPVLNTMKLVSLIVTAASYRFLFLELSSRSKMIGAAVIKLIYKILLYFLAALFGETVLKKFKRDKKQAILVELYESLQEKEASHIRRPVYVFVKFALLQEIDLFFAVISLYLTAGAKNWLDDPHVKIGIKDQVEYEFYLALVLIEIAIHFVLGVAFAFVTNTILKRRAKTITISLWKEFIKVMMEHRWVITGFKGLLLFILIFIFFNDI